MQHGQLQSTTECDDSLVARLYQQQALSLMTYIRRHVPSREEAEDILLEVFLAVLEQEEFAHFSERQQLAWLQRVAYYKCIDSHRRAVRHALVPLEAAETLVADERHSPDQSAVRSEEETILYKRLARLPASYQHVLQMRFAHGLRCREIAQRLNKSEGATRMILSRALALLRTVYTKH